MNSLSDQFLALEFTVEGWRLGLWADPRSPFAHAAARHLMRKVAELDTVERARMEDIP